MFGFAGIGQRDAQGDLGLFIGNTDQIADIAVIGIAGGIDRNATVPDLNIAADPDRPQTGMNREVVAELVAADQRDGVTVQRGIGAANGIARAGGIVQIGTEGGIKRQAQRNLVIQVGLERQADRRIGL